MHPCSGSMDPSPEGLWRAGGTAHPTTSTDNALARYDGALGVLQDSGWLLNDSDLLTAAGALAMAANDITGGGAFITTNASGPQVQNIDSTTTTPPFNPDRSDPDTGLGGGPNAVSLIRDGVEILRLNGAAATSTFYGAILNLSAGALTAKIGYQSVATARTATAAGDGTGQIAANTSVVNVTSGSADSVIRLPAAVIGNRIRVYTTANGCELQTPDASNETINTIDCDGGNELALVANAVFEGECHTATGWIFRGWDNEGADLDTLVPDADA